MVEVLLYRSNNIIAKKKSRPCLLFFCLAAVAYFVNSTMLAVAMHVLFMKNGVIIFTE
jgi:hypothetical protein